MTEEIKRIVDDHAARIVVLETKLPLMEQSLTKEIKNVSSKIDTTNDYLAWMLKLAIGGIIAAIISFIVKGGLM